MRGDARGLLARTSRHVGLAVLPITVAVLILQYTVVWLPTDMVARFLGGAVLVAVGLTLFLFAAEAALLPVGETIGARLPRLGRVGLFCLVGGLVGFAATVAEPDVRVLAMQVDQVSGGAIARPLLVVAVALGVAISVGLAMLRVVVAIPLTRVLLLGYLLVLILAALAPSEYLPVSFDAGGVTTGPMTVPFILALGVGVASALQGRSASRDGFGYVGLASIGPIVAVMLLGIWSSR